MWYSKFLQSDILAKAWNFHPPTPKLVSQFGIKYDTRYWGSTSNIHGSFPTDSWPVLSKSELTDIAGRCYSKLMP
jgi:hypothetical protein